jgi:hypothetical protein
LVIAREAQPAPPSPRAAGVPQHFEPFHPNREL